MFARSSAPAARSVASYVALGALSGLAATWVMGQVTSRLYRREDPSARLAENEARSGKTAYGVAAERLARVVDRHPLMESERKRWGSAIHWALGAGAGAVYGAWYAASPNGGPLRGLAYGTGFFLLADELANTALGLTPAPQRFPWQAHARGLAAHLVYGVAADAALRAMDRAVGQGSD